MAAGRALGGEGAERFGMATKAAVLLVLAAATSLPLGDAAFLALGLGSLAYVLAAGRARMALWLAFGYLFVGAVYFAYVHLGLRPFLFSPVYIYQSWHAYPVLTAFCVLVVSPPGLISAALARLRCPKKAILGTLVLLRFFPTFAASWRLLRDSLRKRGLLAPLQVLRNPLDTYEYVAVPALMALINSADQLSSSAVTRAAEAPRPRTSYYASPLRLEDALCMGAAALAGVSAVLVSGVLV